MKKLFSLLTAVLLCTGMVVQAQLLSAINDTPEGGSIPPEANLIGGRRNTPPSVTWNLAWEYANSGNSVMNTNGYSYRGALNGVKCYRYQWDSDLQIYFCFSDNSATWTSPISGATCVMPARGTYTVSTTFGNMRIGAYNTAWDGNTTQSRYLESGTSYHFTSGTWYVEEGVDGPCMWSTDCYLRNAGTNKLIIGDPAVYKSVTVQSENASKGTVSYAMKSGYVYTTNITDWKEGSTYTINASAKPGYHFDHWSDNGEQSHDITITGDATYTAYFAPNQYTITYKDQGDVTFTGSHESGYPTTHTYGTATTLKSAAKADYTFDGWYTDQNCTGSPVASLGATAYTSNITLYAKWTYAPAGSTYTLNLSKTGNGTVTVRDADNGNALVAFTNGEAQVAENHNVSITATADPGYHLTTLTFDGGNVNQSETYEVWDDNLTIVAVFEPDVYTITYRDKGNQTFSGVHGSDYPTSHTYGTATALVNPTKSGAVFGGWYTSSDCSGDAITSLAATAYTSAPTVYAKWIYNGTITANASPAAGGSVTVNQPSTTGGSAVTLNASANGGYAFTGWDDNNDGVVDNTDAVRTVYVDGDKEYVAKFVVETGSWANYSYDNAQDIIQRDIYQESNAACEAYYSPAGQKFVEVIAVNKSRSTKNYLQLYFKTTTTNYTYPDGEIGPTPGTYLANSGVGDRITSALVTCEGNVFEQNIYFWNWNSWPYECVIGYFKDNTGTGLGENSFSAFLADVNYSSQDPSITNTYQIGSNNFRIIVDTGKDGHMYLQVRRVSNNELLVNIGEPAQPYNLAWDANGGELSGTYTAAGSVNEGTSINAPTATRTGYTFTGWSPAFTGTMPSANQRTPFNGLPSTTKSISTATAAAVHS